MLLSGDERGLNDVAGKEKSEKSITEGGGVYKGEDVEASGKVVSEGTIIIANSDCDEMNTEGRSRSNIECVEEVLGLSNLEKCMKSSQHKLESCAVESDSGKLEIDGLKFEIPSVRPKKKYKIKLPEAEFRSEKLVLKTEEGNAGVGDKRKLKELETFEGSIKKSKYEAIDITNEESVEAVNQPHREL